MHDTDYTKIPWRNLNAHFLSRLPNRRRLDLLVPIQMAGDDAVFPILVTSVEPVQQENLVPTNEKEMHGGA